MKRTLATLAAIFAVVIAVAAQLPVIQCPAHNVPSQFTGRIKDAPGGGARLCEYTHPSPDHTFWMVCQ